MYEKDLLRISRRKVFCVRCCFIAKRYSLQTILNSTSYSRLSRIVLRPFPERKYRFNFRPGETRDNFTARSLGREKRENVVCREWRENGRRRKGGKKSCTATFECRENDSSTGRSTRRAVGAMHFVRDASARCIAAGKEE